jgi:predicted permease
MSQREPLWRRYLHFLGPDPRADVDDELAFHLEELRRQYEAEGLSPEAATLRAQRQFGDLSAMRRTLHRQSNRRHRRMSRRENWLGLGQDFCFALRKLRLEPGFALAAIGMLALGIGACTAIFSIVNGVLLQPLSYRAPGQLYVVREVVPQMKQMYATLPANLQNVSVWQHDVKSFASVSAAEGIRGILQTENGPVQIDGARVSSSLLTTLGVAPRLGRDFRPEEDLPGANHVLLLTDATWRRRFHADPDIVGTSVTLSGTPNTIIGVLPPTFRFPRGAELGPLTSFGPSLEFLQPPGVDASQADPVGDFDYAAVARLKPGVTPQQAFAELNVVQERIIKGAGRNVDLAAELWPLNERVVGSSRTSLLLLLGGVIAVLIVLCTNLAGLLLARVPARQREAAIRTALGASRGQLMRQLLVESAAVAVIGGVLGIATAWVGLRTLLTLAPATLPRVDEVHVDGTVLLFGAVLSLIASVLLGALPAWRISGGLPEGQLQDATVRTTSSGAVRRLRDLLIAFEVATSSLLLIVAALLSVSLYRVLSVEPGFKPDRAMAVDFSLVPASFPDAASVRRIVDRAVAAVQSLPGVSAAGYVSKLPLRGETSVSGVRVPGVTYEGVPPLANYRVAIGDYFRAIGIPMIAGRAFEPSDRGRNVAVVSQAMAAKLWPGQDPLGKMLLSHWGQEATQEVIGVVGDVYTKGLDTEPTLMLYLPGDSPVMRFLTGGTIVARSGQSVQAIESAVRRTMGALDPGVAVTHVETMADVISETVTGRRFQAMIALAFALTANLVAALGIYGVVAYAVEQRRHELGIRMALGAEPRRLRGMVVRQGLRPVVLGLVVGAVAALLVSGALSELLFGVNARDPRIIALAAVVTLVIAVLACWVPGSRASRVDPMRAWRAAM